MKFFLPLICFFSCWSGLSAVQPLWATAGNNHFVSNCSSDLYHYEAHDISISAADYHGSCGRCGWPLDERGKCTNRNCNQYGPPRD